MTKITLLSLLLGTIAGAQVTTINGSGKAADSRAAANSKAAPVTTAAAAAGNTSMPAAAATVTPVINPVNGVTASAVNPAPVFEDGFQRPDQSGLGTAPTGQAWQLSGAGVAAISNNTYVCGSGCTGTGAAYAAIVLPSAPARIGGRFSFTPGGPTAIALANSADASLTLQRMVHLVISPPSSYRLSWWNGTSQDNSPAFCSNAPRITMATDGTVYSVWMTINGDSIHVELPGGSTLDCYDTHFSSLSGPLSMWEITSAGAAKWSYAAAYGPSAVSPTSIAAPGGLQGPVGNIAPSEVYANGIAVGTQTPANASRIYVQNDSTDTRQDGIYVSSNGTGATLHLAAKTAGFAPRIYFDEGQAAASIPYIYSAGNSNDIRVLVNGTDRAVFPYVGTGGYFPAGNYVFGASTDSGSGAKLQVAGDAQLSSGVVTPQSACDAAHAGVLHYSGHTAGVKDTVSICAADAGNVFVWRAIY